MEDVIYIVIGLLWLVFTFYTQSKKRKQREAQQGRPAPPSPEKPKSFFEQIFVETPAPVVSDQEIIPEPEIVPVDVPGVKKKRSSFEEEYEKLGIRSLEDTELRSQGENWKDSGQNNLENATEFDPEMRHDFKAEEGLEFDLRKAVIMAEILERPYS